MKEREEILNEITGVCENCKSHENCREEEIKATIEILNSYYQKGGFYNIPVEVVNDVIGMLEKQTELIGKLEMEKLELFNKAVEENIKIRDKKDEEIERLNNKHNKALEKINDYKIYCKKNKGFTEYTDIEIEAIEPVISKLEDILKEEK